MEVLSYTVTHENSFLKKIISDLDEAQVPFANSYISLSPFAPPGMNGVTSLACTLPDLSLCVCVPKCTHKINVVF